MPAPTYREKQLLAIRNLEASLANGGQLSTIVPITSDYASDGRICLTAVCFLPEDLARTIEHGLIAALRAAQPQHYFYEPASLHATIQNLRTIADPPAFDANHIAKARHLFRRTVAQHTQFDLDLHGVLRLPSSLSISAFSDESLGRLAMALRQGLAEQGIPDDKQYSAEEVVFGNVTVCRYVERPDASLQAAADRFLHHSFGKLPVRRIDLIQTNAVCHPQKTVVFESFNLAKGKP